METRLYLKVFKFDFNTFFYINYNIMFLIISRFLNNFMKPTNKISLGRWSFLECDKMLERRIYMANIDNSYDLYKK